MIAIAVSALASLLAVSPMSQDPPPRAPPYQIDSVRFRFTHYEQAGSGYQSAAGPPGQPGSEAMTIEQPQAEVVARVGDKVTQRIWVPLDVITAASPDHSRYGRTADSPPLDGVTTASRVNVSGSFDALTTYRWDQRTAFHFRSDFHLEEPFESWAFGAGATRSFADDNTVVGASVNQVVDWFDRFDLAGARHGRSNRSTTNANLTVTQLLSPSAIAALSYGGTMQLGTLGNNWNSVLLADGTRAEERLPRRRQRHALAVRVAQWLPWNGAAKAGYRAYLDGWGVAAHSIETDITQRIGRWARVRANYRWHHQSAVRFFTTAAGVDDAFRTADSDLARFAAQTWGGAISFDVPSQNWSAWTRGWVELHFDIGYERYSRSNRLTADITTCGVGFRF
ncbi:MAG: DUF3570 domain-containing protein [Bacteroidota bacterium]